MTTKPGEPTTPAAASRVAEVAELVRRLCVANANMGVYGLGHSIVQRATDEAFAWLSEMIRRGGGPVAIEITKDKAFFEDLPIETRNPQVARLFQRLLALHVNTLRFQAGIARDEFQAFLEILNMKDADLTAIGGIKPLLAKAGVTHLTMAGASYVRVEEDQRVVQRKARFVEAGLGGGEADVEAMRYMLQEVARQARQHDWLLDRIKNSPREFAGLIAQGLEQAVARIDQPDATADEESIRSLIEGIRMVGGRLIDPEGGVKPGEDALKNAMLTLEQEIRNRSRRLMTTEASRRFLGDLLDVVTSYSDRIQASRARGEFLKGEQSLKQAEQLLKRMTPDGKPLAAAAAVAARAEPARPGGGGRPKQFVITEAETPAPAPEPVPPPPPRPPRPRRTPDQALREGIVRRIRELGLDDERHQQVMDRLTLFFQARLAEREKKARADAERLSESVARRDTIIDEVAECGVIIWDSTGRIDHIKLPEGVKLSIQPGAVLREAILSELQRLRFPLARLTPEQVALTGWTPEEHELLGLVTHAIMEKGRALGALLGPRA